MNLKEKNISFLEYPRGSEWRKWDLHVHTPFSIMNNEFGDDFDEYAKTLLQKAIHNKIAVIGVTDYFSIEGYKHLKLLLKDRERLEAIIGVNLAQEARKIYFIPNIELRLSVIVKRKDGRDSKVNFHVIFSDDVDVHTIEDYFLRELKFTAEANPGHFDERWSLTLNNLEDLGKKLKAQHVEFRDRSDLYIGMLNAVVSHEDVTKVLENQASRFKDRYLIVVPVDEDLSEISWNGQGHLPRKILIQKSHMIFSSNLGTRQFCLGKKHSTIKDFKDEFKSLKPCIHGSDSHCYDTLFEPAEKRYVWIKADPTFQGLRQLLNEPEGRIYLGDVPPCILRIEEKATKYMSEVQFERTDLAKENQTWFFGDLPLNHGLVAIIGNKGNGKSALADILALLGDTHVSDTLNNFSFLNQDRFLDPKAKLGGMFSAKITWRSGLEITRRLDESIDKSAVELVKYIPQKYLESICSELKESNKTEFYRELMEVIFSHVEDADRLGKETLSELIDYLTNEKEESISQLVDELEDINIEIVYLENQLTGEYRKSLEAQLVQLYSELKAHEEVRPAEVKEPEEDMQAQEVMKKITSELLDLQRRTSELEKGLSSNKEINRKSALQIAAAEKLLTRIDNLERQMNTFYSESAEDGNVLELDVKEVVTLKVNLHPIHDVQSRAKKLSLDAKTSLNENVEDSLAAQTKMIRDEMKARHLHLDEPNRKYQSYLQQLADWQKKHEEIIGSIENTTSIVGLKAKLAALDDLPAHLDGLKNKRKDNVREIFKAKEQLLEEYRKLYSPVQEFINRHHMSKKHEILQFFASIKVDGLVDGLMYMINKGRKGSFQGEQEGRDRLRVLVSSSDFSTGDGVQSFLESVQEHLEYDKREGNSKKVLLRDQLRQQVSPENLYNFLYGLSYLKPRFELRWQNKPLDQLSPGERGNLLLVFYLLIDKRDIPLIIDQPEENLDNQTIATMLVPAIKEAKERRQIIIVTHNPNLAVVCDADQIIHSQLDKTNGNRVVYTSGSIENPGITELIVDVLEGTKPAFDLRDAKYEILERLH